MLFRSGLDFLFVDHRAALRECVIAPFEAGYAQGLTPNPCVDCNRLVKFKTLFEHAGPEDIVATGHYARAREGAVYAGVKGRDQSYVLWRLRRQWLARLRFPLGGLEKSQARALAAELGLEVAAKKDSMDLCFQPHLPPRVWEIVDESGRPLGQQEGYFTLGQRRGLNVASTARLYVTRIDSARSQVVLGPLEAAQRQVLTVREVHQLTELPPRFEAQVKIRSTGALVPAVIELEGEQGRITLAQPILGGAPEQSAVWYAQDGQLLGGGKLA